MCIQQWNELDLNGNLFQLLKTFIQIGNDLHFGTAKSDTLPDKERCQHIEAFFQKIAIINKG